MINITSQLSPCDGCEHGNAIVVLRFHREVTANGYRREFAGKVIKLCSGCAAELGEQFERFWLAARASGNSPVPKSTKL